jgi:hypothetical protein
MVVKSKDCFAIEPSSYADSTIDLSLKLMQKSLRTDVNFLLAIFTYPLEKR